MENFVTSGHLGLRDLFKDISVNTAALDELDETSLEFLHATVSADTEEMKKRIIDITAVYVFRLFSTVMLPLSSYLHVY